MTAEDVRKRLPSEDEVEEVQEKLENIIDDIWDVSQDLRNIVEIIKLWKVKYDMGKFIKERIIDRLSDRPDNVIDKVTKIKDDLDELYDNEEEEDETS